MPHCPESASLDLEHFAVTVRNPTFYRFVKVGGPLWGAARKLLISDLKLDEAAGQVKDKTQTATPAGPSLMP
jgi:hypothetical protein